jgi:hypothetical protein
MAIPLLQRKMKIPQLKILEKKNIGSKRGPGMLFEQPPAL